MDSISQITDSTRLPVEIPVYPYLFDHHLEGKAVLPAVEALQVLAAAVKKFRPEAAVTVMTRARFDKFLPVPTGSSGIKAFVEIETSASGELRAQLLTRLQAKKSAMARFVVHAAVCFPQEKAGSNAAPLDLQAFLEGVCSEISPEQIYRDLVPFGPSYRNIAAPLYVSANGAIARIASPAEKESPAGTRVLGSPFALDAAFHAACVWAQCYRAMVAFPVGFDRRTIFHPTRPASLYFSRITPIQTEGSLLRFDISIADPQGTPCERIEGVQMRDVSGARLNPPGWIQRAAGNQSLEHVRRDCRALSVLEIKTLVPFAEQALSVLERKRFERMGVKRRQSFLAARLACKRISRILSGDDDRTAAEAISTIRPDLERPCCRLIGSADGPPCSVSHDDRFAVAVAADGRPGIDVERLSGRVLKSRHLFMSPPEQLLTRCSGLGAVEAAIRIWSIKEAAAKALDLNLAEVWRRVEVIAVGCNESRFQIDSAGSFSAVHETVEDHVFTYICLP